MIELTIAEITSPSWKLEQSQVNYFTENFCNDLDSSCRFSKTRIVTFLVYLEAATGGVL